MHNPRYSSIAALNVLQSNRLAKQTSRNQLVYGTDVFLTDPEVLSHKTTVSLGDLQHETIAAISYGQGSGDVGGYVGKIDNSLYKNGVKLSNTSVIDWRPGMLSSPVYTAHTTIHRSFAISGNQVTLPAKLPDGTAVLSGQAFYKTGNVWIAVNCTPNVPATTPTSFSWLCIRTSEPAIFPSISTALTTISSRDEAFEQADIYVREGRNVARLVDSGRGVYQPSANHITGGQNSFLKNTVSGQVYPLPLTATTPLNFSFDDEWVVYRYGVSDRFADVISDLATSSVNGLDVSKQAAAAIDYDSFIRANAHNESLNLRFSGYVDRSIPIVDFINDNALFFNLLSMRDRNRLCLVPHTVEPYIIGIYTAFNCSSIDLIYEPLNEHSFSRVSASIGDNGVVNFESSTSTNINDTLSLNAAYSMQNDRALRSQLERILQSVNRQDKRVSLISALGFQQIKAGDFIIAHSDDWSDDRSYSGGIIKTQTDGIFQCLLENIYNAFSLIEIANNKIAIDFSSRKDSYSHTNFVEGDILVIISDQNSIIYARIKDVVNSVSNSIVIFDVVEFDDKNLNWKTKPDSISLKTDFTAIHYKIGSPPSAAYFYDDLGVPRKAAVRLFAQPRVSDRSGRLDVFLQMLNYEGFVGDSTPIIFDRNVLLWRIDSIEPLDTRKVDNQQVNRHEGYRMSATIYPFDEPKTLPGRIKPRTQISEVVLPTPTNPATDEVKAYLLEVAVGNEFAGSDNQVHKWRPGAIKVAIMAGTQTPEDTATVNSVITELSTLMGRAINLVSPTDSPDVKISFAPESQFSAIEPSYIPKNLGYFSSDIQPGTGHLIAANVLIDTNETNQIERNHLIREEITQCLSGLANDSYSYPQSIFQQSWTTTQDYLPLDREVIKLMSNDAITSGMNISQLKSILATL